MFPIIVLWGYNTMANILAVEDNMEISRLTVAYLSAEGYTVMTAFQGILW